MANATSHITLLDNGDFSLHAQLLPVSSPVGGHSLTITSKRLESRNPSEEQVQFFACLDREGLQNFQKLLMQIDTNDAEVSLETKTKNWLNERSQLSLDQLAMAWLEHHKSVLAKKAAYHEKGLMVSFKLQAPHFPLLPKELQDKVSELEASSRVMDQKSPKSSVLTDRIAKALALAVEAHDGQKRKGTQTPYVAHPMAVASIALEHGADEEQAMAALLHDAVEDGGPQYAERIRQQFGDRVADIVAGCTDGVPDATGAKEAWQPRKERYIAHLKHASDDVLLVSGSDKLHNARAIVEDLLIIGPAVFDRFTATKEQTLWYYEMLAGIFAQRGTPIAKALTDMVQRMKQLSSKA